MPRHVSSQPFSGPTAEHQRWHPEQRGTHRRLVWLVDPISAIPGEGLLPSRTWALARALVAGGHEVIWWTSSFSHTRHGPRTPPLLIQDEEGFAVRLIKARRYRRDMSLARFASHRDFAAAFERMATEEVAAGQLERPDLLVAVAPPHHAGESASRVAHRLDAELILDLAEWWPEPLRPLLPGPSWLRSLLAATVFPALARRQWQVLSRADALLAASQTTASHAREAVAASVPVEVVPTGAYLQDYPAPPPFIDHVPGKLPQHTRRRNKPPLTIAVAGDLNHRDDLLRLVDLARCLTSRSTDAVLHVIGGGRWMPQLATTAPLVKGCCRIVAHGLIDRSRYVSLLAECQVGLVQPGLLSRFPLPAEAADYAAAGLAIVVAGSGELANMVSVAGAGLVTADASADTWAAALAPLADDPRHLSRLRHAARRLAETSLDRERLAAGVVDWLESLAVPVA